MITRLLTRYLRRKGLNDLPAIPFNWTQILGTFLKVRSRQKQIEASLQGLNNQYQIGSTTATAYEFMFGQHPALSLDSEEQWAMSWTTYGGVYSRAQPNLAKFSSSLINKDDADKNFWPTLSTYGIGYNLLVLQKVKASGIQNIQTIFSNMWTPVIQQLFVDGLLYFIDTSIFDTVTPQKVNGFDRFTPSTITLLKQDSITKEITPISVRVSRPGGNNHVYIKTDNAWLYALHAAKTSITVFGIWLGHVYSWHLVTAALLMTLDDKVSKTHPIRLLLGPQSNYVIPFDDLLLLVWGKIAPTTSINGPLQFLQLTNTYAQGRNFFDDDPKTTLTRLGIIETDFTHNSSWDMYPIVRQYLDVWESTDKFIEVFVDDSYVDDVAVANDHELQTWISASSDPNEGNIRGIPNINNKLLLRQFLTSIVYRITIHGVSRLLSTAEPGLAFMANLPQCLQKIDIPSPNTHMSTKQLLEYLPNTKTIGGMVVFLHAFVFSEPYESFIPQNGLNTDLFFPNGTTDPRNIALIEYRTALKNLINITSPNSPPGLVQTYQWPLNIET